MARWDLHPEVLDEVPTEPLLRDLAEDVAADAKRLAPVRSARLRESIHVDGVYPNAAYVSANPRNPDDTRPDEQDYAGYIEKGTSRIPAQPFLRPALFRYRS